MKIAFFETYPFEEFEVRKFFKGHEIVTFSEKLNKETAGLAKDFEIVSVFINCIIDKETLDLLPNLKLIATRSTGFDHIDCAYAKEKGVQVASVPAYGSNTVAEFTFALILWFSRQAHEFYNQVQEGKTDFDLSLQGFDLYGKTLGVVGTGKIGRNVIKIAKGFGMNVLAHDHRLDPALAEELGFEFASLDEILASSDIVTLHIPAVKENYHILSKDQFSMMKRGSYLINTARGELVDTEDLVWALEEGILAGAGLDVLEKEKELKEELKTGGNSLVAEHKLISMPNAIFTSHKAFFTQEAVGNIIRTTHENIMGFIEEKPINLVE